MNTPLTLLAFVFINSAFSDTVVPSVSDVLYGFTEVREEKGQTINRYLDVYKGIAKFLYEERLTDIEAYAETKDGHGFTYIQYEKIGANFSCVKWDYVGLPNHPEPGYACKLHLQNNHLGSFEIDQQDWEYDLLFLQIKTASWYGGNGYSNMKPSESKTDEAIITFNGKAAITAFESLDEETTTTPSSSKLVKGTKYFSRIGKQIQCDFGVGKTKEEDQAACVLNVKSNGKGEISEL